MRNCHMEAKIQPIRVRGDIDPSTGEQNPDKLVPPDGVDNIVEFRDGAYWIRVDTGA